MNTLPPASASPPPPGTLAVASLVFGILCWFALPVVGSFGAIICGHMARAEIRRSHGSIGGDGYAVAGLVLGYLHLLVAIVALAFALLLFGGIAAFLVALGLHGAG